MTNQISPIEAALVTNDLSKLTTEQRMLYYKSVCESVGLNPLTQPFSYINLNGKLTLYAKRDATDQLRKVNKVSITITSRDKFDDIYVVTARAKDHDGREDESTGAVSIANLKGDALANAFLKAETKAKRRVTLSICGLGLLDESETDSIKGAVIISEEQLKEQPKQLRNVNDPEPKEGDKKPKEESNPQDPQVNPQKKEPERFPKKEEITISKEQAEFLKSTGHKFGYKTNEISKVIFDITGKESWGAINNVEFELILQHIIDNRKGL